MSAPGKTVIFVDGDCIVCDFEIAHYKRIAPELFELVDISAPGFDATVHGLTKEAVNENMHVLTPNGELRIGVDAFAHIWSRIGRYAPAAKLINHRAVKPLAKLGYKAFTVVRPYLPRRKR